MQLQRLCHHETHPGFLSFCLAAPWASQPPVISFVCVEAEVQTQNKRKRSRPTHCPSRFKSMNGFEGILTNPLRKPINLGDALRSITFPLSAHLTPRSILKPAQSNVAANRCGRPYERDEVGLKLMRNDRFLT